jgi:hypothetical protein
MKRIIYSLAVFSVLMVSCDLKDDFEQINSQAVEYAGQWNFAVLSGDLATEYKIYDRNTLITYNTSDDKATEIWIDDQNAFFPAKFKAILNGDLTQFSAPRSNNFYYSAADTTLPAKAKSAGLISTALQTYKAFEVLSGSIMKGNALTKTGNITDSIYLHISAFLDEFTFLSAIDKIDTTIITVAIDSTLIWEVDTIIHYLSPDSTYFDEDWVQINDTVYYQIDSLSIWDYEFEDQISAIDSSFKWIFQPPSVELTQDRVISGTRTSGFVEDIY